MPHIAKGSPQFKQQLKDYMRLQCQHAQRACVCAFSNTYKVNVQ